MTAADRFNDLQLQGFMKMGNKAKKLTPAERKAKAEDDKAFAAMQAQFRAETAARYDAWFAADAVAE